MAAVSLALGAGLVPVAGHAASDAEGPVATPAAVVPGARPLHNLSAIDIKRYRAAFAAQDNGDFAEADRLAAELGDLMLVGHLLRVRYLDTARYAASTGELASWLAAYSELPGAEDVAALAAAANPAGAG